MIGHGVAVKHMEFPKGLWMEVLENAVPPQTGELNKKAFLLGYEQ